jgi:hypothetical protein
MNISKDCDCFGLWRREAERYLNSGRYERDLEALRSLALPKKLHEQVLVYLADRCREYRQLVATSGR